MPGLPDDLSSHSLRVGAINTILHHPMCDLIDAVIRAGHDCESIVRTFCYAMHIAEYSDKGQKALAGCPSIRARFYGPAAVFVDTTNDVYITNFMASLFSFPNNDFSSNGNISALSKTLLASYLQHRETFASQYGNLHIVYQIGESAAQRFQISTSQLKLWGKAVQDDYDLMNKAQVIDTSNGVTKETIETLTHELQSQRSELREVKDLLKQVLAMVKTIPAIQSTIDSTAHQVSLLDDKLLGLSSKLAATSLDGKLLPIFIADDINKHLRL